MSEPNPRPIFGTSGMQWGSRSYIRALKQAFPVVANVHGKPGPWSVERVGLHEYRPYQFHGLHTLLDVVETPEELAECGETHPSATEAPFPRK